MECFCFVNSSLKELLPYLYYVNNNHLPTDWEIPCQDWLLKLLIMYTVWPWFSHDIPTDSEMDNPFNPVSIFCSDPMSKNPGLITWPMTLLSLCWVILYEVKLMPRCMAGGSPQAKSYLPMGCWQATCGWPAAGIHPHSMQTCVQFHWDNSLLAKHRNSRTNILLCINHHPLCIKKITVWIIAPSPLLLSYVYVKQSTVVSHSNYQIGRITGTCISFNEWPFTYISVY